MDYSKFFNKRYEIKNKNKSLYRINNPHCPGFIGDKNNKKPGGYNRFNKYYKLPTKIWKLHWKIK